MPELPELEVVREVLKRRVVGQTIMGVEVVPPGGSIVIRDLTHQAFDTTLVGATIREVVRRGKFLVFSLETDRTPPLYLAVNPKLTGRLQLTDTLSKRFPKTWVVISLSEGQQLRYVDQKTMGQIYLTQEIAIVPDYASMGPEALDISLVDFRTRLRPLRGEIKGILARSEFVAGIGNAYADEILWAARLHPYRKRTELTPEEIDRLHSAMRTTLLDAIEKVRSEMQENIHLKPREFLAIHMKAGQPCPRCGTRISEIRANQRITNYCLTCQPGGLFKGM